MFLNQQRNNIDIDVIILVFIYSQASWLLGSAFKESREALAVVSLLFAGFLTKNVSKANCYRKVFHYKYIIA